MTREPHDVQRGNVTRKSFSKVKNYIDMPDLVEIQKKSYQAFIEHDIAEVFKDFSPIEDFSNHYKLYFLEHSLEEESKYDEKESRNRGATYSRPLKVKVRLENNDTGEVQEHEVYMGDLPKMTDNGSFIINGAERVVVSQLVKSPSVYNNMTIDNSGKKLFDTKATPNRGAWLEFEQDSQGVLYVHVDRNRKITATILLRALDIGDDEQLLELFGGNKLIKATLDKEPESVKTARESRIEVYKRIRQGEIPTEDAVKQHLYNLFFDPRKYDLSKVGRYKYNKKLGLRERLVGCVLDQDIVNEDGEIVSAEVFGETIYATKGTTISEELALEIQNSGVNEIFVLVSDVDEEGNEVKISHKIIGNKTVSFGKFTGLDYHDFDLTEYVYYPVLKNLMESYSGEEFVKAVKESASSLSPKNITIDDIIATVSNNLDLTVGIGTTDNIDHLGNRRVRSVGELLQNSFRKGLVRLEKVIKEKMSTIDAKEITPQKLINVRPVTSAIREFFGSSQLSQFMDQNNPIAELTHKRKLSALGPGGLNRERATFDVRDVHYTHYGRMCPIETPEGQNIGLITSLSSYAKINEYGFIESPYRRVNKSTGQVTEEIIYMTADKEDRYTIAQATEPVDEDSRFVNERIICRRLDQIISVPKDEVDFVDVSPKQLVSVATALIPFLENDDTNRALMGSNMQRQAVPLLKPENAIVATGIEAKIAYDSGIMVIAKEAGRAIAVSSIEIIIEEDDGTIRHYPLKKFERSNQGTCLNQKPIISTGDYIKKGQIIADGPATANGELSLGRNILIGFMAWEGYNYEDAILISENLVRDDVFTSIHIEDYEIEARDTKLGPEEFTRDIPNVSEESKKDLDENGIIRIGAEVTSEDILVGKVTPKGETELTPEERLLRAIFGEKSKEVRDTSLRVPHGAGGIVVDVKIFTRENKDELAPNVNKMIKVYIAQKRKISVGDKMAGRHGNKGVISRVLPQEDMPFLADGTPLQIVLNPLGVPSRMNLGQVLEVHLGLVCKQLGWKIETPVFDGATEADIKELLYENNFVNKAGKVDGKIQLYDGRTGEPFDNGVTVGQMYMIKLHHLVDDKIHARSIGPYSLVTQQPLGGKAQFGGQRFGEMEVWALEAYGAAHILQEILTVKSDDIVGRVKTYNSIVNGNNISEPGIPEAFKVLLKELQSLGLDINVLNDKNERFKPKDFTDEDLFSDSVENERQYESEELSVFSDGVSSGEQSDSDIFKFNDDADEELDLGDYNSVNLLDDEDLETNDEVDLSGFDELDDLDIDDEDDDE